MKLKFDNYSDKKSITSFTFTNVQVFKMYNLIILGSRKLWKRQSIIRKIWAHSFSRDCFDDWIFPHLFHRRICSCLVWFRSAWSSAWWWSYRAALCWTTKTKHPCSQVWAFRLKSLISVIWLFLIFLRPMTLMTYD